MLVNLATYPGIKDVHNMFHGRIVCSGMYCM